MTPVDNNTVRYAEPDEQRTVPGPGAPAGARRGRCPEATGARNAQAAVHRVGAGSAGRDPAVRVHRANGPLLCLDHRQPAGRRVPGRCLLGQRAPGGTGRTAGTVGQRADRRARRARLHRPHPGRHDHPPGPAPSRRRVRDRNPDRDRDMDRDLRSRSGAAADPAGRAGAHPGDGPAPVGLPARVAVRAAGHPGGCSARPGHSVVRGARGRRRRCGPGS